MEKSGNHRLRIFRENLRRMQYHQYLKKGYPIASSIIERACRHYIRDRMERAGMSWLIEGAQAMLDVRSIHLYGQWDEFTAYRRKKEEEKLYPYREAVNEIYWPRQSRGCKLYMMKTPITTVDLLNDESFTSILFSLEI